MYSQRLSTSKHSFRSQNIRRPTFLTKSNNTNHHRNVICKSIDTEAITTISYYVGKSIILFTIFYTGLNYFHYKQLREDAEEDDNTKNKKNKK